MNVIGAYLKKFLHRKPSYWYGHNPAGGLFVFLMLIIVSLQIVTGLFSDPEDYINIPFLADYVSRDWNRFFLYWHSRIAWILLFIVFIHISAVLFYKIWKKEDLIRPMLTGMKIIARNK